MTEPIYTPDQMRQHELKTWPTYFEAIAGGLKTFEIRHNNRGFCVGDSLRLREWDPVSESYTGREIRANVVYVLGGKPEFGLSRRFVIMGFKVQGVTLPHHEEYCLGCGSATEKRDCGCPAGTGWRMTKSQNEQAWEDLRADGGLPEAQTTHRYTSTQIHQMAEAHEKHSRHATAAMLRQGAEAVAREQVLLGAAAWTPIDTPLYAVEADSLRGDEDEP